MQAWVNELLPLAAKIAREFANIPGLPHAEIEMAAQEALARAARSFDPAKGDFAAYAATAMRNALRDLHDRQARHHRRHIYNLDVTVTSSATSRGRRVDLIPARQAPVTDAAAAQESMLLLNRAMAALSPRLRQIAEGIRDGKSFSEIGASLGISKQAAHKLSHAAITSLREKLEIMGYSGLDTLGLLKSAPQGGCGVPAAGRDSGVSPPVFPPG